MIKNCSQGSIDQLVRSLPCHGRGYGFKSRWNRKLKWAPRKLVQNGHLRNYINNLRKFNYDRVAFFPVFCYN